MGLLGVAKRCEDAPHGRAASPEHGANEPPREQWIRLALPDPGARL